MDPGQGLLLVDVPVPRHRVGGVVSLFQNIAKFGESILENWSLARVSRAFEVEVACIFPRGSTVAFAAGVGFFPWGILTAPHLVGEEGLVLISFSLVSKARHDWQAIVWGLWGGMRRSSNERRVRYRFIADTHLFHARTAEQSSV